MVAKPGGQKDVPYLAKLIAEQNVQSLLITSSVLDIMVESFKEHPPTALRDVCNCGEAFPVAVWPTPAAHSILASPEPRECDGQ